MKHTAPHLLAGCLLATLLAALPAGAAESYDSCTGYVDSLPAVISTQGTWCLRKDLATGITSGVAILVNTNNVSIDCNGFKLGGLAAGPGTQAEGIRAQGRLNTSIRHCHIRGFRMGIHLLDAGGGHTVEDNRLDGNTVWGMYVRGPGSLVRGNLVLDTGGASNTDEYAYGIGAIGGVDVIDNTISGVATPAGSVSNAFGVLSVINHDASYTGNRIRGVVASSLSHHLWIDSTDRATVEGNELVGPGNIGIYCSNASTRVRDNIVAGFPAPLSTCGDAGGNDTSP